MKKALLVLSLFVLTGCSQNTKININDYSYKVENNSIDILNNKLINLDVEKSDINLKEVSSISYKHFVNDFKKAIKPFNTVYYKDEYFTLVGYTNHKNDSKLEALVLIEEDKPAVVFAFEEKNLSVYYDHFKKINQDLKTYTLDNSTVSNKTITNASLTVFEGKLLFSLNDLDKYNIYSYDLKENLVSDLLNDLDSDVGIYDQNDLFYYENNLETNNATSTMSIMLFDGSKAKTLVEDQAFQYPFNYMVDDSSLGYCHVENDSYVLKNTNPDIKDISFKNSTTKPFTYGCAILGSNDNYIVYSMNNILSVYDVDKSIYYNVANTYDKTYLIKDNLYLIKEKSIIRLNLKDYSISNHKFTQDYINNVYLTEKGLIYSTIDITNKKYITYIIE